MPAKDVKQRKEYFKEFGEILVRRHSQNYILFCDGQNRADDAAAHFGRYLRAARLNRDLSIAEVAARTGITEAVLTALEQGIIATSDIKPRWLRDLAKALGENVEDFDLLLRRKTGSNHHWVSFINLKCKWLPLIQDMRHKKELISFAPVIPVKKFFSKPVYTACSAALFGLILGIILFLGSYSGEGSSPAPQQEKSFINVSSEHRLNRIQAEFDFERQVLLEPISYNRQRMCCIY